MLFPMLVLIGVAAGFIAMFIAMDWWNPSCATVALIMAVLTIVVPIAAFLLQYHCGVRCGWRG